jgi:phosphatidylglycerol---prolipoprotein diacylglyceryl transferase
VEAATLARAASGSYAGSRVNVIPYYPQPVLHLGPFSIHAFGALAATAIVVGGWTVLARAQRRGIPVQEMFEFCAVVYLCSFAGAVGLKIVLDNYPDFFLNPGHPFRVSLGFRSVGAIVGGILGGLLWRSFRPLSLFETLRRLDIVAYSVPLAFMIGRLGCTLAHDHRGIASTSWIAVRFPEGPRYDLGLIEFLFLIGVVIAFRILDRHPRPAGFYIGLFGVVYGGFRIWLDTLQNKPLRFYGGVLGVLMGLSFWIAMLVFERHSRLSVQPAMKLD